MKDLLVLCFPTYGKRNEIHLNSKGNHVVLAPDEFNKYFLKYKLDFELKRDEGQKMVKNFSATTNSQIFVVRKSTQQILYKGKMDNGFENIGKKRQVITEHYLRDALESILQKKEIVVKETQPVGCFIIKTKTP